VPINKFAGEICCSRYGLHIDWYSDPDAHKAMFAVLDLVDGTRSLAQIAEATGQSVEVVTRVLDRLEARNLIGYGEARS
jgi:aminopeptidase-like protein